jgi:hypothetical protein
MIGEGLSPVVELVRGSESSASSTRHGTSVVANEKTPIEVGWTTTPPTTRGRSQVELMGEEVGTFMATTAQLGEDGQYGVKEISDESRKWEKWLKCPSRQDRAYYTGKIILVYCVMRVLEPV